MPPPKSYGSGHTAAKNINSSYDEDDDFSARRPSPAYSDIGDDPESNVNILESVPETTIGEKVTIKGNLAFQKLLRIDGTFEGVLESTGDLIIGRTGTLVGDVVGMGELVIDGRVRGNITASKVELRARASVHGSITCCSLTMDPTCVVVGSMNVNPFAPGNVGFDGKKIETDVKPVAPVAPVKKEEKKKAPPAPVAAAPAPAPAVVEPAPVVEDKVEVEDKGEEEDGEEKKD